VAQQAKTTLVIGLGIIPQRFYQTTLSIVSSINLFSKKHEQMLLPGWTGYFFQDGESSGSPRPLTASLNLRAASIRIVVKISSRKQKKFT
jgi:hypothetical protein